MAFKTSVWFADTGKLQAQDRVVLESEKRLEDWIANDLSLLGEDLLLIGRQVRTTGGPLDLLAMDSEGALVIAELKRDRTPREVVAQVLDYASWVRDRSQIDIDEICRSNNGLSLAARFELHFESPLPESACDTHRMLIVAAELDDSSERIIRYLQDEHEIDINAVFFSVYRVAGQEMLVRAWLADPEETQQRAVRKEKITWGGTWFLNTGVDNTGNSRDWENCRKYGFISAGGGEKYSKPLYKLQLGDAVAAYISGAGYVGLGTVRKSACPVNDFLLGDGRKLSQATLLKGEAGQPKAEHAVGIEWKQTVSEGEAKTFRGVFASQHVLCKLRNVATLDFIRQQLGETP